jgi:hypothetical protein
MSCENPYELPPPSIVADLCAQRAWDDEVDDDTRLRLEFAADTIRHLMQRLVRQALHLERAEAAR